MRGQDRCLGDGRLTGSKMGKYLRRGVVAVLAVAAALAVIVASGCSAGEDGEYSWPGGDDGDGGSATGANYREMVFVEGGTFTMGCTSDGCNNNERESHKVTISSFYIGKYEVSQEFWWKYMSKDNPVDYFYGANMPVQNVSWDRIQTFLYNLNNAMGLLNMGLEYQYRLPTEAEWEYAARGGKKGQGYKYSGGNDVDGVSWYYGNSYNKTTYSYETHPIGKKRPNELGIYDMSGNVREWVNDWYQYEYSASATTNPTGPSSGDYRVIRGGGYRSNDKDCRVSSRDYYSTTYKYSDLGFRLARTRTD